MIVAPMIFFTILDGIIGISDTAIQIERLGKRLVIISLLKLAFYVSLGLSVGFLIGKIPEISLMFDNQALSQQISHLPIRDFIVRIIPSSTLSPFNENNVLQLLFLACFFGIVLSHSSDYVAWAKDGIKFMSLFTIDVTRTVSSVIPYLVMVSMTELISRYSRTLSVCENYFSVCLLPFYIFCSFKHYYFCCWKNSANTFFQKGHEI